MISRLAQQQRDLPRLELLNHRLRRRQKCARQRQRRKVMSDICVVLSRPSKPGSVPIGDHSPRKKLKIAEMVIRKLYKKNLELEKALAQAKADLHRASQPAPYELQLEKPPTLESVRVIELQKDEYLKHLAAEQDKTIQELRRKLEEIHGAKASASPKSGKITSSAAVISRLQKRLQEAIGESSRQKNSYIKLKSDYKRLLLQRTRSISGSSEVDSHARELLALMEKRLLKVEDEREQDMALYNMKLFETEQKNCDDYVAKKMLENEIYKVTKDAREREDLDNQIEKCMFGVFERLHQVEQENIRLREAHERSRAIATTRVNNLT
ncbi:hypothetical protein, variant [Aphanomyces invadans]|uniref:Uncharacterized protein n=1 Tax=Aphanomyces invadans TaxID=157072 RepID=A0A024UNC2_9STRA|nr:hypothetical protein, variant [Aphanomyces invadans]ETW07347.1 hypothetical protein, variant [Aphanomyces invadans]|eukprot:XP_008863440.1 hypothetical protein, variant [Aphanomyces invadans]